MAPAIVEPLIVLLFVAVVFMAFMAVWRRAPSRNAETRLLRMCRGDRGQVERLIEGELRRSPGIARHEAAARAVRRYERDNR